MYVFKDGSLVLDNELTYVPARLTIAEIKRHSRKGFIWLVLSYHCASLKESGRNPYRPGTCRQELTQKPRRGDAYWLAPYGFLNLLSYRTQDHLWGGPTHNGLCPPRSLIKNIPHGGISQLRLFSLQ